MLFTVVESKWEFQELINFCPSPGSHLIGNFQFKLKSGIMFFKEREMEREKAVEILYLYKKHFSLTRVGNQQ